MWRYVVLASRLLVGGFFLLAGVGKLLDVEAFAGTLERFQILPMALVSSLAIILPLVEVVVGVFLMLGLFTRFASVAVALMLLGFSAATAGNVLHGNSFECGCLGVVELWTGGYATLVRNTVLCF